MKRKLFEGADPFIFYWEGTYYIYPTAQLDAPDTSPDGFCVYVSKDLENWECKGFALHRSNVKGENRFWTPEMIARNGRFYMVYTSEEHIAVAVSDSPLGPFVQTEQKWLSEEKAIDGHFFTDDDGQTYLYYVRLHNGLYYLTYSSNHTRSPYYAVGYAVSASPTGPFEKFVGNPILCQNGQIRGVGHHSFAQVEENKWICAYHSHHSPTQTKPRIVHLDFVEFVKDENGGADRFVIHGPTVE